MVEYSCKGKQPVSVVSQSDSLKGIKTNAVRIARLRLLMITAKVVMSSNQNKDRYSIHDSRTPALLAFMKYLDLKRSEPKHWKDYNLVAI